LFAIYGTTYGAGDGVSTFNLPDFRNRTIWGADDFGYLSAGLPNITGTATAIGGSCGFPRNTGSFTGAFYNSKTLAEAFSVSSGGDGATFAMDASRSNSIYGKSDTVQPPAIKVRVVTRYK
jgi:microcystin-dependent protein